MADAALMIGWGRTVRGREQRALDVFNEALAYYGERQADGTIEEFDTVLLTPHGGDLDGFFLVKGSPDAIGRMVASEEFQRLHIRAGLIVENLGIVQGWCGEGLARQMGWFAEAIADTD
jgi:hypothetical protein